MATVNANYSASAISAALTEAATRFHAKLKSVFPPPSNSTTTSSSPSTTTTTTTSSSNLTSSSSSFTKNDGECISFAVSNLLGGIGYWHGDWLKQLVEPPPSPPPSKTNKQQQQQQQTAEDKHVIRMPPTSLFSAVPSRSFFPRGFLWDEGFHQLLMSQFDLRLSLRVMTSWLAQVQMNGNDDDDDSGSSSPSIDDLSGWLPREQILGDEARARVPDQFQAQKANVANPPTLILTLGRILTRLMSQQQRQQRQQTTVEMAGMFFALISPFTHSHSLLVFDTHARVCRCSV